EATPRESETLWAATYFLMGLRYDAETAAKLIPKGKAMKESTTYQATLEVGRQEGQQKGRHQEAIRLLLRLGQKTLGVPGARVRAQLDTLDDLDVLESLVERVNEVASWDELLPPLEPAPQKTRKRKS